MLTVGVDVPDEITGDALDAYLQGRSQIHMPESVESHPGFMRGTVYERVGPRVEANDWPTTVTVLELDSVEAADGFVDRLRKGPRGYPAYRAWTTVAHTVRWRALWRRSAEQPGQLGAGEAPHLRLVGYRSAPASIPTSPAPHGVVNALRYASATSYSLVHNLAEPSDVPPTLAAYPAFEATVFDPPADPAAPPAEAVLWDCVYRRLTSYVRAALM
jgi:hypothetical protein